MYFTHVIFVSVNLTLVMYNVELYLPRQQYTLAYRNSQFKLRIRKENNIFTILKFDQRLKQPF